MLQQEIMVVRKKQKVRVTRTWRCLLEFKTLQGLGLKRLQM